MALTQQQRHLSKYANDTAADVLAKFTRTKKKIIAVTLAVYFAFVFVLFRIDMTFDLSFPAFMALILGVGVVIVSLESIVFVREWACLLQVLTHDRDPYKLGEVLPTLISRAPNRRGRRMRALLYSWSAVTARSLGKRAEARDFAEETLRSTKSVAYQASALDVLGSIAAEEGDTEAAKHYLDEILKLQAATKPGTPARKCIDISVLSSRERLAVMQGAWADAAGLIEQVAREIETPLQELGVEFRRGRIAAGMGDLAAASHHYRFVATYGNTTDMRRKAQAWLDEHAALEAPAQPVKGDAGADSANE